jgi:BirA family biotin operon repressor/biotin-[acetyl-CoA-carboxylase] ligase
MKIGDPIHFLPTCTSTNDVVKDLAAQGASEGTVVVAEEQTSGKGRYKSHWFSSRGMGIYISILLRPPHPEISLLTLSAGLAAAEALWTSFGVKACLIGNQLNFVVVGIGINLNHSEEDFPTRIRKTAISLKQIKHKDFSRDLFLLNLWKTFEIWYDFYMQQKTALIVSSFMESSCYSPGQKLVVFSDKGAVRGTFKGIDQKGGAVLETRDGINSYFSVDIKSIREAEEN